MNEGDWPVAYEVVAVELDQRADGRPAVPAYLRNREPALIPVRLGVLVGELKDKLVGELSTNGAQVAIKSDTPQGAGLTMEAMSLERLDNPGRRH